MVHLRGSSLRLIAVAAAAALGCQRGAAPERAEAPPPVVDAPTKAQREAEAPSEQASRERAQRSDRRRRAAERERAVRRIEGTLERRSEGAVVIRAPGEERVALGVTPSTTITVDGRPATLDALREGAEVRAAYASGRAGRPTALSLEVRSAPARDDSPAPDAIWVPNTGERGSAGGG